MNCVFIVAILPIALLIYFSINAILEFKKDYEQEDLCIGILGIILSLCMTATFLYLAIK